MARITDVLGGLFGRSPAALLAKAGLDKARIDAATMAERLNEGMLELLEQRQLMFGLTILPPLVNSQGIFFPADAANQFVPGFQVAIAGTPGNQPRNLFQFNANNAFAFNRLNGLPVPGSGLGAPTQPGAANASATAQFAYFIPVLQQNIGSYTAPSGASFDFADEWTSAPQAGVSWVRALPPAPVPTPYPVTGTPTGLTGNIRAAQAPVGTFFGTTFTTTGTTAPIPRDLRIDYRNLASAAGAPLLVVGPNAPPDIVVPPVVPPPPTPSGDGVAMRFLLTGAGQIEYSLPTTDGVAKRSLLGASMTFFDQGPGVLPPVAPNPPNPPNPNPAQAVDTNGNTVFKAFFRGQDVSAQFDVAIFVPPPGAPVAGVKVQIWNITPNPTAIANGLYPQFDTVQMSRRVDGAGVPAAGTDVFELKSFDANLKTIVGGAVVDVPTLPGGRYDSNIITRTFGADARTTGRAQFGAEFFDSRGLSRPQADTFALPSQTVSGLTSRLVLTRGNLVQGGVAADPTIGNFTSAYGAFGGVANNQALRLSLTENQFFNFQFQGTTGVPRIMTSFAFNTSGTAAADGGILGAGTSVRAFRNGVLVNWTLPDGSMVTELTDGTLAATTATPPAPIGWFRNQATNDAANVTYNLRNDQGFDTVQFVRNAGTGPTVTDAITIDNVAGLFPQVLLEDTYGRALANALDIAAGPTTSRPKGDQGGDGMPDYNDGIGRATLSGSTGFSISGGLVERDTVTNQLFIVRPDPIGILAAFQTAGFGYAFNDGQGAGSARGVNVRGLPAGTGSVIIGAPFFRDPRTPTTYLGRNPLSQSTDTFFSSLPVSRAVGNPGGNPFNVVTFGQPGGAVNVTGFTGRRVDPFNLNFTDLVLDNASDVNGVFGDLPVATNLRAPPSVLRGVGIYAAAPDGGSQNFASLLVHGIVHGGSTISGTVGRLNIGVLLGSLTVEGDVGSIFIAGNAGVYNTDLVANDPFEAASRKATGTIVTVGGSIGQYQIGGKNQAELVIRGDIASTSFDRRDSLRYTEVETIFPSQITQIAAPALPTVPSVTFNTILGLFGSSGQPMFIGTSSQRNDTLASAEFVGGNSRSVVISGRLGLIDGLNPTEDVSDAYGFTTLAGNEVTLNVEFRDPPLPPPPSPQDRRFVYARVFDSKGRLVASHQYPLFAPTDRLPSEVTTARFKFTAEATGVYYLVLNGGDDSSRGVQNSAIDYTASIAGLAPVVLGLYDAGMNSTGNSLRVLAGDVGLIRIGLRDTSDSSPTGSDRTQRFDAVSINIAIGGSLHAMLVGGDLTGTAAALTSIVVGGNIGELIVGVQTEVGYFSTVGSTQTSPGQIGDIVGTTIRVGGSIGRLELSGSIAHQTVPQQNEPQGPDFPVSITTGTGGGPGNINQFLVGGLIRGSGFVLRTSNNSVIDQFIVGNLPGVGGGLNGRITLSQPDINMGTGSDIRFARITQIASVAPGGIVDEDKTLSAFTGAPLTLEDDSGVRYIITLTGFGSAARIRQIPVSGSRGAALGRLDVALAVGGTITITTINTGNATSSLSIGTMNVIAGLNSRIIFSGNFETDVLDLRVIGAAASISNTTPNGDIVSLEATSLGSLDIRGDLGRTQVSGANAAPTSRNGVFALRFARSLTDAQMSTILGGTNGRWGGAAIEVPVDWIFGNGAIADFTMEDVGAPIDRYLNGLWVNTGSINSVRIGGQVGDVLVPGGTLVSLVANSDGVTAPGRADNIAGNVFALEILTIDIGDGLASAGDSPFARAGIFANGSIQSIIGGTRVRNPLISGIIIAGANTVNPIGGIGSIVLGSGRIDSAYIGSVALDSFWRSARLAAAGSQVADQEFPTGRIGRIALTNGTIFGSRIFADGITTIAVTGGNIDATAIEAAGEASVINPGSGALGTITADNFTNTTTNKEPLEFRFSTFRASGNIGTIRVNNTAVGIMSDTLIDAGGRITGVISARIITRVTVSVVGTVAAVTATDDIRSTSIVSGGLVAVTVGGDLRSSTFDIAGAITRVTVTGSVSSSIISSSGPFGIISSLTVGQNLDADISSSGPVTTIAVTRGDFTGTLRTTEFGDGNLGTLSVGRDMLANLNIAGGVTSITASRHIGRRVIVDGSTATTPDAVNIDGNLGSITAGGQMYADVVVGGAISGVVSIGSRVRPFALPGGIGNDQISDARILAFGRIATVSIVGDYAGAIRSESGGIGRIAVTNGSMRKRADGVASVVVNDGDLSALAIINGSLFGDVIVKDGSITSLTVSGTGAFGNLGVDPDLSSGTAVAGDTFRNQLPPGVTTTDGVDGPRIWAGRDLTMSVAGSAFEAGIYAGNIIRSVAITGSFITDAATAANPVLANSAAYIAAGELVTTVSIGGRARGLNVLAGIMPDNAEFAPRFGADQRPGGIGVNADSVQSGRVNAVTIGGAGTRVSSTRSVAISSGVNAGGDGLYATDDGDASETSAAGISSVGTVAVNGPVGTTAGERVRVKADTAITSITGVFAASVLRSLSNVVDSSEPAFSGSLPVTGGSVTVTSIPANGVSTTITLANGVIVKVRLTGTNVQAVMAVDSAAGTNQLIIRNTVSTAAAYNVTRLATVASLIIDGNTPTATTPINNLQLVTSDDVSIGTLAINLPVTQSGINTSSVYVDGNVTTLTTRNIASLGQIRVGGDLTAATIGPAGATATTNSVGVSAGTIGTLTYNGGLGKLNTLSATPSVTARNLGTLNSTGNFSGRVSVIRDITRVSVVSGVLTNGSVRAGGNIGTVAANGMQDSVISARGNIGPVSLTVARPAGRPVITGDMIASQVIAGVDIGPDGIFGTSDDVVSNGNAGNVTISGIMTESDVTAGLARGADGFFGTSDDVAASGRSSVGIVRAIGGILPTSQNSQSFRVSSNGTVGQVFNGAVLVTQPIGNFKAGAISTFVSALQVTSLVVTASGGVYTARISFNRGINSTTLASALSVANLRADGVLIPLTAGNVNAQYTVSYDPSTFIASVRFNPAVTTRNLANNTLGFDTETANPGPGTYRFVLDAAVLRATEAGSRLDGNGDGFGGDSYTVSTFVGDVGDRLTPSTTLNQTALASNYGPASLDAALSTTGLPVGRTVNGSSTVVRGVLGDHPDFDSSLFQAGSDLDLYSITLEAGQTLRLGALSGTATFGVIVMLDSFGAPAAGVGLQTLVGQPAAPGQFNAEQLYLVLQSGQYIVAVGNGALGFPVGSPNPFLDPSAIDNTVPVIAQLDPVNVAGTGSEVGAYNFTVNVDGEGNSGFAGLDISRGSGAPDGPVPTTSLSDFAQSTATRLVRALAGPSTLGSVGVAAVSQPLGFGQNGANSINDFTFSYLLGVDSLPGVQGGTLVNGVIVGGINDDEVVGSNGAVIITRTAGADQTFGTADDVIVSEKLAAFENATLIGGTTRATVPGNASFTTATTELTRTSSTGGGRDFKFRLFLGADNARGANGFNPGGSIYNDDFVMGTDGATIIIRTSGADGVIGTGAGGTGVDDLVYELTNRPMSLPLDIVDPAGFFPATPAPQPSFGNFPSTASRVSRISVDGSAFTWRLDLGVDGQRNPGQGLGGDDIVIGDNASGTTAATIRVIGLPGADGAFNTGDDSSEIRLLSAPGFAAYPYTPSATQPNLTMPLSAAPLPTAANFPVAATLSLPSTVAGNPSFDFTFNAGPDGYRGIYNGRDDDSVVAVSNGITVTRTAGADQLFGTADDVLNPAALLLSKLDDIDAPVPSDFIPFGATVPSSTLPVDRIGTQGINYRFFFRPGTTAAQDTIVGYSGTSVIRRSAGVDGILGNGDDLIRQSARVGGGLDLPTPPRPNDFAASLPSNATQAQITAALNSASAKPFIDNGVWRFVLEAGANGRFDGNGRGTTRSDDLVVGTNDTGQRIEYRAGPTGVFGGPLAGDVLIVIDAIGPIEQRGQPSQQVSDVDVFNLNNGQPILAGTRFRVTLRTSETGANFGRLTPQQFSFGNDINYQIQDLRALVQLALFERSSSSDLNDAQLIASPQRVEFFGGTPNTVLAGNTSSGYGYDAAGDFYMEFTTPDSIINPGTPGVYAMYVQGAIASKYSLELRQLPTNTAPLTNRTQNVYITTAGGSVGWLESSGRITSLRAYDPAINGFAGLVGTQTVLDYMISGDGGTQPGIIAGVNNIFNNVFGNGVAGFNSNTIRVSANLADFAGQEYSTIYLSGSVEPNGFFNNGNFGAVERVDMFNANAHDQGVVFMPSLNARDRAPTKAGIDGFINDVTFVVGRQIGQLVGLRLSAAANPGGNPQTVDFMATSGTQTASTFGLVSTIGAIPNFGATPPANAGSGPRSLDVSRPLSGLNSDTAAGTQFFLGQQNSAQLLRRIFGIS